MRPTGEQYEITSGDYRAVVTQVGGGLRLLTHGGRNLVATFAEDQVTQLYRGAVLVPWPNRVASGRYTFDGTEYQLPINEPPPREHALHGLVLFLEWRPVRRDASSVTVGTRLWPQTGYPFLLDFEVTYALSADAGLAWTIAAVNSGDRPAPYGCSIHPYVVAGEGKVDDWTLRLPAASWVDVDARLLPAGTKPVADHEFDFRAGKQIGATEVDHAFTDVEFGADGRAVAQLLAADGSGVQVTWDSSCPWVQVHTADRPEPENNRVGLALEPMTCPPDAFNSGTDLAVLEPGARHEVTWHIAAVPA
ncbi:MAG TPA: aldose 1-epimerase family protein [Mycobacteriales bacterium]|nr:aldose 1-epimerase family protein [Mycobacteriales bacterium]